MPSGTRLAVPARVNMRGYRRALYAQQKADDPLGHAAQIRKHYQQVKARDPEGLRLRNRWRIIRQKFGLSQADYEAILARQGGVCAICGEAETARYKGRVKWLAVDHDHATGRLRGLLCQACNLIIGFAADDRERVAAALSYLGGGR